MKFDPRILVAALAGVLLIGAVAFVATRGGDDAPADDQSTGPQVTLESEPTPTATPEPEVADPEAEDEVAELTLTDAQRARLEGETKPVATAFVGEFFAYTWQTDDLFDRLAPHSDEVFLASLVADFGTSGDHGEENKALRAEIERTKTDARAVIRSIEMTDVIVEPGAWIAEFTADVRVDNRKAGGPWTERFSGFQLVTVENVAGQWVVTDLRPA